ncbi:MAG: hypothetical protein LIV11_10000 [Bacillota bacterium]|uniref:Uncharacterized protein n=1 Tax=[Clostridium] aminophilum TaxID=1526 RepID=A0A1I6IJL7_9FIRM|nr:hypothetical protein [[Clostridium] aminophilum]MDT3844885.1 hypothetical protein [Bacillota bacterium]SET07214.1 hypothetical protein SAMN04487771_100479 [[Clostridium] aminophilum]SFR66906.1 hypothetical protein SAMN02910262_00443 [[Clostridium] aminophilum]
MGMNPADMFKAAGLFRRFQNNHPKVVQFIQLQQGRGVPEGTVIEMTIQRPGEEMQVTNMRVLADDIEILNEIRQMKQ